MNDVTLIQNCVILSSTSEITFNIYNLKIKTMKLTKIFPIVAMLCIVLISGCQKDDLLDSYETPVLKKAVKPPKVVALEAVNLRSAADFVILSQAAITDVSPSVINGNIGASPITGAAIGVPCDEVEGIIYSVDDAGPECAVIDATKLGTAVLDFGTAYTDAAGRVCKADAEHLNLGAGEIGGLTLAPGVYHWDNNVTISTDVTLEGGKNDVWIFQVPGTLNISSATSVILKGVNAKNIFWVAGGAVTLGTTSHFEGNILGATGITLETGASINGRLLAGTQVALQMSTVKMPNVQTDTGKKPKNTH